METAMKKTFITMAAAMALIALPTFASADPAADAAAGAAVGAGAGFLLGGPLGAAVGAGVGGTVGAGSSPRTRENVIIEHPRRESIRERTCTRDSLGHVVCEEVRR